jgi:hypothetical protein
MNVSGDPPYSGQKVKSEATVSFERAVIINQTTRHQTPEGRNLQPALPCKTIRVLVNVFIYSTTLSLLTAPLAYTSPLKMETVRSCVTSVNFYQATRRHIAEDSILHYKYNLNYRPAGEEISFNRLRAS